MRYLRFGLALFLLTYVSETVNGSFITIEAESGSGDGSNMSRSNASGGLTVQLDDGETRILSFNSLPDVTFYEIFVRYSNDNFGPLEKLDVDVDTFPIGSFFPADTGGGGFGWNNFLVAGPLGPVSLAPGPHQLTIAVTGGDGFGVEIDMVTLQPVVPEPHSLVLLCTTALCLVGYVWRRRRQLSRL